MPSLSLIVTRTPVASWAIVSAVRPQVAVGGGGYLSGPVVAAAAQLRAPLDERARDTAESEVDRESDAYRTAADDNDLKSLSYGNPSRSPASIVFQRDRDGSKNGANASFSNHDNVSSSNGSR